MDSGQLRSKHGTMCWTKSKVSFLFVQSWWFAGIEENAVDVKACEGLYGQFVSFARNAWGMLLNVFAVNSMSLYTNDSSHAGDQTWLCDL